MIKEPTIANNIRRLRFDADEMSQNALAGRVGVTRQTIAVIEKAKYFPTLELVFLIAYIFGKQVDEVFTLDFKE